MILVPSAECSLAPLVGMAEMTLIKLGEIVDKPQRKRVQMIERAAEEMRAAAEARQREAAASVKELEERSRQVRRAQPCLLPRCDVVCHKPTR